MRVHLHAYHWYKGVGGFPPIPKLAAPLCPLLNNPPSATTTIAAHHTLDMIVDHSTILQPCSACDSHQHVESRNRDRHERLLASWDAQEAQPVTDSREL